jgi:hypothetical protein
MNAPMRIGYSEWREIMEIPAVKESWGLTDETVQQFAAMVYGVKFHFQSGTPGYVGDLYILHPDELVGAVWVLTRRGGKLDLEM